MNSKSLAISTVLLGFAVSTVAMAKIAPPPPTKGFQGTAINTPYTAPKANGVPVAPSVVAVNSSGVAVVDPNASAPVLPSAPTGEKKGIGNITLPPTKGVPAASPN